MAGPPSQRLEASSSCRIARSPSPRHRILLAPEGCANSRAAEVLNSGVAWCLLAHCVPEPSKVVQSYDRAMTRTMAARPATLSLALLGLVAAATAQLAKNRFRELGVCIGDPGPNSISLSGARVVRNLPAATAPQRPCCGLRSTGAAPLTNPRHLATLLPAALMATCPVTQTSTERQLCGCALQRSNCWRRSGPS